MGKNYLLSQDGVMMALVEITDTRKFDEKNFIEESEKSGFKVQVITDVQKQVLMPKDVSLN